MRDYRGSVGGAIPDAIRGHGPLLRFLEAGAGSEQHPQRFFEAALDGGEEVCGDGAVKDAVVGGEGAVHQRGIFGGIPLSHRAALAFAKGEDAGLRRVDDSDRLGDAVHAKV